MIIFSKNATCENDSHNCCTAQSKQKQACPECSIEAKEILEKTVKHLIVTSLTSYTGFHYCRTPSCEVIYFRGNEVITQKDLNVLVGIKNSVTPSTICYCFGWSREKIKTQLQKTGKSTAISDIKEKMNRLGCSCEILNPSGECCLGDIGKEVKVLK